MTTQTHDDPRMVAAAERQMNAWAMNQEIEDRADRSRQVQRVASRGKTFVAISREEGAGGSEIGRAVGQELGWEVLDKSLLDRVAERAHVDRETLELVDETPSNWVYDVLGTWMDREIVPHQKYVSQLRRVMLAAARHGNVVLVGRGAQFLLPRNRGLAVRIVAPEKYRIEQMMTERQLPADKARHIVREADEGRREFVQRFFHHDINDPHLYDLVINVEQVGRAGAVELILVALSR